MPVVISNTSPIQYLYQTGTLSLLPDLFGEVVIPEAVAAELDAGRQNGVSLPDLSNLVWIQIRSVCERSLLPLVTHLGDGEKEVLALGLELSDSLLLLDDRDARRHARLLNIAFSGTLGVLVLGKEEGHLRTIRPIIDRLNALGFRLHPSTHLDVLRIAGE